jgi:L-lactate utilization protein LutC
MGSVLSPGLFGVPEFGALARASSLCGACQEACPVDIPLPKLLLRVRAAGAHPDSGLAPPPAELNPSSLVPPALRIGLRLYTWAASSPRRFQAAQRLAGWFSRLLSPRSEWLRLPAFTGWGASRDLPRPAKQPFRDSFPKLQQAQAVQSPADQIAAANIRPTISEQVNNPTSVTQANLTAPLKNHKDLVERFCTEIESLGGQVLHCTAQQAGENILELLKEINIERVQAWSAGNLPLGVTNQLLQAGIHLQTAPDPQIRVGLTGVRAAAADTGSLALASAPGQPLTASLLPEIHIACLRTQDIVPTMADLLSQPWVSQAANTVLISGPSRTADIEMTLTIGVHGPKELIVVCIDESPSPAKRRSG